MIDMMVAALHDPFDNIHMGETAENLAESHQITRGEQDALAVESHRRAAHAIAEGRFKSQILPITLKTRKGETVFDTDEHVRADATAADLAKLRAVFRKDGTVTAGNASGINDARRGRGADGRRDGGRNAAPSRWGGWWPMRMPGSIRRSWASARCRRRGPRCSGRG